MPSYDSGSDWTRNRWAGTLTGPDLRATTSIGFPSGVGAGGTVTQLTSKSTGVTLNASTGLITLSSAALASDTVVSFTLTNDRIAATDVVLVQHDSVATVGAYAFSAQPAAGSAVINVANRTTGSLSEAIVLRFLVLKGANS